MASQPGANAGAQSNFRVLIADDEGPGPRRLMDFLRERGFGVEQVTKGKSAKEKIRDWQPHFVICDLMLPECNAPALLAWMKSEAHNLPQKSKIFVTSAHNVVENIRECITAGASDYIVKPYKPEDILTRLIFHIQNKREVGAGKEKSNQLEGADIYQIAKNCRTSVEMIEKWLRSR